MNANNPESAADRRSISPEDQKSGPQDAEVLLLNRLRETPELFEQLRNLAGSELAVQRNLRSMFDPELVPAAVALHEVRNRAAGILPCADQLWLTRVGLEQATAWTIAQHKAARFPADLPVMDLCSGIGVDSAALLSRGPVTALDISPAMSLRCAWNIDVWRRNEIPNDNRFDQVTADIHQQPLQGKLIHVDPDRRGIRNRPVKRLEQYCPNLEWMQNAVNQAEGGAIKLGPASNFIQKFPGCQIELVSLNGECREATVWFGSLAEDTPYRATTLTTGESIAADPLSAWCPLAEQPGEYLFDPDPAIVRSGLLDVAGEMHNLRRLDKEEEYLTGDAIPSTAFLKKYRVEAVLPNNLKDVKRHFRSRAAVDYEVKCRHLHVDASLIQKKLPRGDGPRRTLFFLRINGRARIAVAERVVNHEE